MRIITTIGIVLVFINLPKADWQVLNSPTENALWSVCFTDTSTGWAVGENGTIIHTTNGGTTWEFQSSGVNLILYGVFFIDSLNGWVVGDNGTILHTSDSGMIWENQSAIVNNELYKVYFIDSNIGWAVGNSIIHTSNGGNTWVLQSGNLHNTLYGLSFVDEFNGWAVGGTYNYQYIIHTTNGGTDWYELSNQFGSWLYSVYFVNELTGWISGQSGTILHTSDSGNTWIFQNSGSTADLESIFFTDNDNGWISGDGGTILHTTNAGSTWNSEISNTNLWLYSIFFTDAYHGWAVGYNGVIIRSSYVIPVEISSFDASINTNGNSVLKWSTATESNNRGFEIERKHNIATWEKIGFVAGHGTTTEPQSYSYIDDISNIPLTAFSYRLKQIDFNGGYEYSQEVEVKIFLKLGFSLEQNYPNPFNPITKIKFSIPNKVNLNGENGHTNVQLNVFDILGNKVATLVDEKKEPGIYEVDFLSSNLASGVYIYQLKAGVLTSSKKMLLLH